MFIILPNSLRIHENARSDFCFAKKTLSFLINTTLMKLIYYLVQNLYPNVKYKLTLFENCSRETKNC